VRAQFKSKSVISTSRSTITHWTLNKNKTPGAGALTCREASEPTLESSFSLASSHPSFLQSSFIHLSRSAKRGAQLTQPFLLDFHKPERARLTFQKGRLKSVDTPGQTFVIHYRPLFQNHLHSISIFQAQRTLSQVHVYSPSQLSYPKNNLLLA
jgi:hypothetical protein